MDLVIGVVGMTVFWVVRLVHIDSLIYRFLKLNCLQNICEINYSNIMLADLPFVA